MRSKAEEGENYLCFRPYALVISINYALTFQLFIERGFVQLGCYMDCYRFAEQQVKIVVGEIVVDGFLVDVLFQFRCQRVDAAGEHKVLPYQNTVLIAKVVEEVFFIDTTTPYT